MSKISSKGNKSSDSSRQQLNQQIDNLSSHLKKISNKYPKIQNEKVQSKFRKNMAKARKANNISVGYAVQGQFNKKNKNKIQWNSSAQSWTREVSPSHSIPRQKRFRQQEKSYNEAGKQAYPELYLNLRKQIDDNKGVSFAKSLRPHLFTIQPNPSPSDYDINRYLQNCLYTGSKRSTLSPIYHSRANPENQLAQTFYHIKGGTINKFDKYESQYYPHTKRLNYNEKTISTQMQKRLQSSQRKSIPEINSMQLEERMQKTYGSGNSFMIRKNNALSLHK